MTHPILVTGAAGRVGGLGAALPVFLRRVVSRFVRSEFLVVIEMSHQIYENILII